MLSYRKLAMRVLGRPLHTGGGIDSPRPASQRAAAFILTAAMLTTLAAPAFADTWCIENGNITVKAGDTEGTNKVSQGSIIDREDTNTIITNSDKDTASSNTVTIDAGNDKVEVTLDNVNIKAGSGSALTSKGDVTLTLKGDNHLTGGISDTGNYGRNGIASTGSLTITGGENGSLTAQGGSGADGGHGGHGIYSNGSLTISGGSTVTANGGNGGNVSGDGISSNGSVTISGGTVTANGGDGSSGGDGIRSGDIDLSGSLELTAKAGSPNGKALSQRGNELDLDDIKDKLGPGAKVTATDANGETKQVSIPRPVEPEEPSSSSDGGSATPSTPASPLPGLTVTDKSGAVISYTSTQSGNTLTVCVGRFTASLRASLSALRQLRAEGIDTITFQTILCSTTLSVDELLAMGGEDAEAVLTHRLTDSSLTVG